jgi:YggT family protein
MFVVGNLVQAVALILGQVLEIYYWVVLIAVVLSWVGADPSNPIIRMLHSLTEPVFEWIRRHVPFAMVGFMDLSPMIVFFSVLFLKYFLVKSLLELAVRLH